MSSDEDLDISRLLGIALDVDPPKGLTKKVMGRLAGVTTVLELGRLVAVAPLSRLLDDEPDSDELDSDEPDSDEPDSDEPASDEPDSDEPDSDEPDSDEPASDELKPDNLKKEDTDE